MKKVAIGFPEVLTIVFITLKLCGVIDWNWIWVVSPIWIPVVTIGLFAFICKCCEIWENIGTVPCRQCKYGSCLTYSAIFGSRIHCRKENCYHSSDYRCKEGEYD